MKESTLISVLFISLFYPLTSFSQELTPLIYFEFEEGSGSSTTSSSSAIQGSLINNPNWNSQYASSALEFTPPGYVLSSTPIQGAQQMTIAAWFKTDLNVSSVKYIVAAPKANQILNGFDVHVRNGSIGSCNGYGGSFCQSWQVNYSDDKWHHIAATYDGVVSKLFFDGQMVSFQSNNGLVSSQDNSILVGSHNRNIYAFTGLIDDVYVDTIALSDMKINRLYSDNIQVYNNNYLNCSRQVLELNYIDLASHDYKAINSITSAGTIENNSIVSFLAGDNVQLDEFFFIESGSELTVRVTPCN